MTDFTPIVTQMKRRYAVRVRRWRPNMSGCAWRVSYDDGRQINWIESPLPRTPISLAIFLHEVGHHVIGFETYKRRCEEEYHAWTWALTEMRRLGITADERVLRRVRLSLEHALDKAVRRGLTIVPEPLQQYARAA